MSEALKAVDSESVVLSLSRLPLMRRLAALRKQYPWLNLGFVVVPVGLTALAIALGGGVLVAAATLAGTGFASGYIQSASV